MGDTLTPKRLARLFRFQISEWILNNRPSFLSTKYLLECNNPEKVFPCAEYFIDESESGELIQAYSNLDALMDTNFVSKVNSNTCKENLGKTGKIKDVTLAKLLDKVLAKKMKKKKDKKEKETPHTLTPKRLARLFRFQISEWILNNRPSFLSTKYLLECNNPEKVFPCAEYFIDESESGELIQAYSNLDALMDTNFVSKVNSVIRARKTSERLAKLKMSH